MNKLIVILLLLLCTVFGSHAATTVSVMTDTSGNLVGPSTNLFSQNVTLLNQVAGGTNFNNINVTNVVKAGSFSGNGSNITGIQISGVTGLASGATTSTNTIVIWTQAPTNNASLTRFGTNVLTGLTVTGPGIVTLTTNGSGITAAVTVNQQTNTTLTQLSTGNGGGLTNVHTSFIGGLGDSYSAYSGGTTNQWIDQVVAQLTNIIGGVTYTNAAISGSWVEIEMSNQVASLVSQWGSSSGPKLVFGMGGINDLSSGGLHNNGMQTSNQVFTAVTNIIATVHNNGGRILWAIQPAFGGNPPSATTYGTNWFGYCQLLRQLTNGSSSFPSNTIPDYLVDMAAHQDEYEFLSNGHPGLKSNQTFASEALQAIFNLPSYNAPLASAVHFTQPNLKGTNYMLFDPATGQWINGFGGVNELISIYNGNLYFRLVPGYQWQFNNGSINLFTLDSTVGSLSINGSYFGNGSGLTNLNAINIVAAANKIPAAVTLSGSPFTFQNTTPLPLECCISGGTAYSVNKNGVTVFSSLVGNSYTTLAATNKLTITYTVAPTFYTNN